MTGDSNHDHQADQGASAAPPAASAGWQLVPAGPAFPQPGPGTAPWPQDPDHGPGQDLPGAVSWPLPADGPPTVEEAALPSPGPAFAVPAGDEAWAAGDEPWAGGYEPGAAGDEPWAGGYDPWPEHPDPGRRGPGRARRRLRPAMLAAVAAVAVIVAAVVARGTVLSAAAPARSSSPPLTSAPAAAMVVSAAGQGDVLVAAGSSAGHPAIWRRAGRGRWMLLPGGTPVPGPLAAVASGAAGWVAFGDSPAGPAAAASGDGITWHLTASLGAGGSVTGTADGPGGYVAVGRQVRDGRVIAAMWWSTGLRSWAAAGNGGLDGRLEPSAVYAVTAAGGGFAAAGTHGTGGAVWTSGRGRRWHVHDLPLPPGAASADLKLITAAHGRIVAAGAADTAAGAVPVAAMSADGGRNWVQVILPGGSAAVTALGADGPWFIAAGRADGRTVLWSSPDGVHWTAPRLAGTSSPVTAIASAGGTVTAIMDGSAGPAAMTLACPAAPGGAGCGPAAAGMSP